VYSGARCSELPTCQLNCFNGGTPRADCASCECKGTCSTIAVVFKFPDLLARGSAEVRGGLACVCSWSDTGNWEGLYCQGCSLQRSRTCGGNGYPNSDCSGCTCLTGSYTGLYCNTQYLAIELEGLNIRREAIVLPVPTGSSGNATGSEAALQVQSLELPLQDALAGENFTARLIEVSSFCFFKQWFL